MASTADPAPQPQLIYCVEPDPDLCELLTALLTDEGYAVSTSTGTPDPVDDIVAADPALCVVAISQFWPQGLAILKRLRAHPTTRSTPVIVTAHNTSDFDAVRAAFPQHPGHAFLLKPFSIDDLTALVNSLIGPGQTKQ